MIETEKLELKEIVTDDIYKSVIAFANNGGGTVIIGISDSGEVKPPIDIDNEYTRLTNGIRDAISPDVTIFTRFTLEERGTIRIDISEGVYKPYYLKSKGLKPSGVYIRQGASSVPASPEQIRLMIKNADGDQFEDMRSLEQDLTFDECSKVFKANNIPFGEDKFAVLGIKNQVQNQYTNLALLLSEQCTHTIKAAVFADEQNTVFSDRKEFNGSVLRQANETFDYLMLCNKNRSVINGLARQDFWDYPVDALREGLLNAIIHRDYSFSGSIIINVNDKQIEIISIGGLLPGLEPDDIKNGISQLRNRKLAEVFHRLKFIEAYGTGIRRIFALYKDCTEKPDISITHNSFKLTLPNMNAFIETPAIGKQEKAVLDYLTANKSATKEELQNILGVKRTRLFNLTKHMSDNGLIKIIGRGEGKRFVAADMV
jgi:ATP-dependent DNA helicase RecG